MRTQSSIAKITQPRVPDVLPRKRLFRLLDATRKKFPVIWVSGPAGSGKTTLVSSYLDSRKLPGIWYQMDEGDADIATFFHYMGLAAGKAAPRIKRPLPHFTPEYQFGVPTFTRRYFENLFTRMTSPSLLVFDNYQLIPADSPFHDIILQGLSEIPAGINVCIISRGAIPPSLARSEANGVLQTIDWDSLRLHEEEVAGIMKLNSGTIPSRQSVQHVYGETEGWAAGVVLMTRAGAGGWVRTMAVGDRRQVIFNFFAGEIFSKVDARTREFLLKTSLFPKMTRTMAERMTGMNQASRILAGLHRDNYFTERRANPELTYQFHALFREYLLRRATETLPAQTMTDLQKQAGTLLEEDGQIEAAAELYVGSADWASLLVLLMNNAPSFVSQGRTQVLAQWLAAIPEQISYGNAWVLYWKGVCKLVFDPNGALPMFEQAFALFTKEQTPIGRLLAWSGIVDTYIYAWNDLTPVDRWINVFEEIWKQGLPFPSRDIEIRVTTSIFSALFLRAPWRHSLPYWESCATRLLGEGIDISAYPLLGYCLMLFYTLKGDFEKASAMYRSVSAAVRSSADNPVLVVIGKAIEAYYWWFSGPPEKSLQAVSEGLAAANSTGLHFWDHMFFAIGTYNLLAAGDYLGADTYLRRMESVLDRRRLLDVTHYHYNVSWSAVVSGDLARAREQGDLFMQIPKTSAQFFINLNRVAMAHVLIMTNERSLATTLLEEIRHFLDNVDTALLKFKYHLARAHFSVANDDVSDCAYELGKAFEVGRARRIYRFDWWLPAVMRRLCAIALEHDIETSYVRELISRNELLPEAGRPAPSFWPWPVKIYMLGQFGLELDGRAVVFGGKTPKKPLELLKAIVALGGRVNEERIMDLLWPEASGDLAYKSFEVALQRLRKIINGNAAIRRQDGQLSLDGRCCWTDVSAFEMWAQDPEQELRNVPDKSMRGQAPDASKRIERFEKAIALYKGHFLPGDAGRGWAMVARERLRSKFLRLITKSGEEYERQREWKKAVECFEHGLEQDAVCEEFYQRLMICHSKLGHGSEVVKTYHRCRAALRDRLRLEPSTKTEEIYSSIRGKG